MAPRQDIETVLLVHHPQHIAERIDHRCGDKPRATLGDAFHQLRSHIQQPPQRLLEVIDVPVADSAAATSGERSRCKAPIDDAQLMLVVTDAKLHITGAFFQRTMLRVKYKTEEARTTREVEPHYLLCSWPGWYLVVWDHLRAGVRALRLDRIESAQTLDTPFRLRAVAEMLPKIQRAFRPL
jgi:hypothetical protein